MLFPPFIVCFDTDLDLMTLYYNSNDLSTKFSEKILEVKKWVK